MYPDLKVDVAVMCASSNVDIAGLGRSLAGVASPRAAPRPLVSSETTVLDLTFARLIAGAYYDSVSTDVRVFVTRSDSVFSGPWGNARLRAVGAATLVDDAARERFDFFATDSTMVRFRLQDREGRERTYWKQKPSLRDRADLLAIAGRYVSRELAATLMPTRLIREWKELRHPSALGA